MDDFIRPVKQPEEPKKKKSFFMETVIITVIIISLGIGFFAGYFSNQGDTKKVSNSNTTILDEAYQTLEESWYNTTDEKVDIGHNAILGLVDSLDPHTAYWTPKEATSFNQAVDGNYEGIGVAYRMVSTGAMVTKVYAKSPALEAGMQVGDIITKAGDTELSDKSSDDVKDLIRGKVGTNVQLTLLRGDKTIEASVERRSLEISVNYDVRESNGKKFGYIEITTFGSTTGTEVASALETFTNQGVGTLVFDFRGNTGGYLVTAKDILNLFFKEGEVIYQMQAKEGPADKVTAEDGKKYAFSEGYVLVNGETASASEIVAGALQEKLGYKLVGSKTYGKGTAQTQKELSDGSILKYTYAKWLTPKGVCVNGKGLTPDSEVNNVDISNIVTEDIKEPLQYDTVHVSVIAMQKMLSILGYPVDRSDGYFSNQTKEALQQFEKDHGLTVNGIYDNNDHQMLISQVLIFINDSKNDMQYAKLLETIK